MFGLLGSLLSTVSGIAPGISNYLSTKANVEAGEFKAMTESERAEYVAYVQSVSALNAAKVSNASGPAHLMVYLFGLPAALHWGAVFVTATFPGLGFAVYPLHGDYGIAEKDIAESFFLLAPTLPLVGALSARLRG